MIIISTVVRRADSQAYRKAAPQSGGVRAKCSITICFSPEARSDYCERASQISQAQSRYSQRGSTQ